MWDSATVSHIRSSDAVKSYHLWLVWAISAIAQHSSTVTAALSQPASQGNPKSKQPGTSATGTSAHAPKQKRTTKAAAVSGGGKPKKGSTEGSRKKSDADPLAPKKPSNSFFWSTGLGCRNISRGTAWSHQGPGQTLEWDKCRGQEGTLYGSHATDKIY